MKNYGINIPQVGFKLDEIGGVQRPPNLTQWAVALQQYLTAESTTSGGMTQSTSNVSMNIHQAQRMQNYVTQVDGANGPITVYLDPASNTITQIPDELGDLSSYQQLVAANPSVSGNAVPAMLERAGVEVPGHGAPIDPIIGRYQQALDNQAAEQAEQAEPTPEPQPEVQPEPQEAPQSEPRQDIAAEDTAETEAALAGETEEPVVQDVPEEQAEPEPIAQEVPEPPTEPEPVAQDVPESEPVAQEVPEPQTEPIQPEPEVQVEPDIEPPTDPDLPSIDIPEVETVEPDVMSTDAPIANDAPEAPAPEVEIPDDPAMPEADMPDISDGEIPDASDTLVTGDPISDITTMILKTLGVAAISVGGAAIANRIKQNGQWNQANIVQGDQASAALGTMMTTLVGKLYQTKEPRERNRILKGALKQAHVAYQTGNNKWIPLRGWEDLRRAATSLQSGEVTAVAKQ